MALTIEQINRVNELKAEIEILTNQKEQTMTALRSDLDQVEAQRIIIQNSANQTLSDIDVKIATRKQEIVNIGGTVVIE